MKGEVGEAEIFTIVSLAGGCEQNNCADERKCICRIQTRALAGQFRIIRRRTEEKREPIISHYKPSEVDLLVQLHDAGLSIIKIAEALGRTEEAVWQKIRSLRKAGILPPARSVDMDARRDEILAFIQQFWSEHGCGPSNSAIRAAMGLKHKSQVSKALKDLEAMGKIRRPNLKSGVIFLV